MPSKQSRQVSKYIVYEALNDRGEIVYIGSGETGREQHISSGCSHVYEANKYHFDGRELNVRVIRTFKKKESALIMESLLIKSLTPLWNKCINIDFSNSINNKTSRYDDFDDFDDFEEIFIDKLKQQKVKLQFARNGFVLVSSLTSSLQNNTPRFYDFIMNKEASLDLVEYFIKQYECYNEIAIGENLESELLFIHPFFAWHYYEWVSKYLK